jgi:3-oxoacyl-[acyl-carrier-protein] synthase-3
MTANELTKGILITADPYSKIVDPEDKNTALLFGDAATATYITRDPVYFVGPFNFGTIGKLHNALECRGGKLKMNGREVFNFVATYIPQALVRLLEQAQCSLDDVDAYFFHQGSRYIVETIATRLTIPLDRLRFGLEYTGNTVSSSIPMLVEKELKVINSKKLVLSGFGVGLTYANCLCTRA